MVELCASIRSTMRASTSGQIELFSRLAMSGTGTCTVSSKVLAAGGATMVVGRAPFPNVAGPAAPTRNRATSSAGRTVADRPIRCAGVSSSASRRSSDNARCAPRLVPATACTSSTITVCTPARVSRAAEVSIKNSDSGVVMRMSGGRVISSRRWAGGVSPERTPTLIRGTGSPSRSAMRVMPVSGVRRLRSTSTARALSGETYSTLVPRTSGWCASRSIAHRNAASVLPDPVGAITRVLSPLAMADQAWACAGVGCTKVPANQLRVSGLNRSNAWGELTRPDCQAAPTLSRSRRNPPTGAGARGTPGCAGTAAGRPPAGGSAPGAGRPPGRC